TAHSSQWHCLLSARVYPCRNCSACNAASAAEVRFVCKRHLFRLAASLPSSTHIPARIHFLQGPNLHTRSPAHGTKHREHSGDRFVDVKQDMTHEKKGGCCAPSSHRESPAIAESTSQAVTPNDLRQDVLERM